MASISTPVPATVAAVAVSGNSPGYDLGGDVDEAERERVAHGDEVGGALGGLNAGEAGDLEGVALGVVWESREDGGGELDEGGGDGLAAGARTSR